MGLHVGMHVNDSEVVSHPCRDDRISLPHPNVRTKHKLSIVEQHVERMKNQFEDIP